MEDIINHHIRFLTFLLVAPMGPQLQYEAHVLSNNTANVCICFQYKDDFHFEHWHFNDKEKLQ